MRKLLVGVVLAVAMAAVGPPAMAQQLDRLTIERLVPPAPSVAIDEMGVSLHTVYRTEKLEALPLKIVDKAAGKKKNDSGEQAQDRRSKRASAPSYHLRL